MGKFQSARDYRGDGMADEKKRKKKSYTFLDKRGVDHDEPAPQKDLKGSGPNGSRNPAEPGPRAGRIPDPKGVPLSIDFTTLIMSFASAAMISMGRVEDPATGAVQESRRCPAEHRHHHPPSREDQGESHCRGGTPHGPDLRTQDGLRRGHEEER